MYTSEYSYQKLPPPLEKYIPAQNNEKGAESAYRQDCCDKELLDMLVTAAKGEREAQEFFGELAASARSGEERGILRQIKLDEQKHEKILAKIYLNLTGREPEYTVEPREALDDASKNYDSCFFGKLQNVEFYRKIMFGFQDQGIRDLLFEIISDEQNHALKIIYIR